MQCIRVIKNKPVGISFPKKILKQIDKDRQDIPRSKFILKAIEKTFDKNEMKINSQEHGLRDRSSSEFQR